MCIHEHVRVYTHRAAREGERDQRKKREDIEAEVAYVYTRIDWEGKEKRNLPGDRKEDSETSKTKRMQHIGPCTDGGGRVGKEKFVDACARNGKERKGRKRRKIPAQSDQKEDEIRKKQTKTKIKRLSSIPVDKLHKNSHTLYRVSSMWLGVTKRKGRKMNYGKESRGAESESKFRHRPRHSRVT